MVRCGCDRGGRGFRAAPGPRRVGRLDDRAEEHAIRRVLPGRAGGLPDVRRAARMAFLRRGAGAVRAGAGQQDGYGHAPGSAACRAVVAARTTTLASGRAAAGAVLCGRRRRRRRHRVVGGGLGRRIGTGVRPVVDRARAVGQPRRVVLCRQARLANPADVQLSALGRQSNGLVAVSVSGSAGDGPGGVLGGAKTVADAVGQRPVLLSYAGPGARLLQRVPLPVFVCRRSLSILCEHRPDRADRGGADLGRAPPRSGSAGGGRSGAARRAAVRSYLPGQPAIRQCGSPVSQHAPEKPGLVAGTRQSGGAAIGRARGRLGRRPGTREGGGQAPSARRPVP